MSKLCAANVNRLVYFRPQLGLAIFGLGALIVCVALWRGWAVDIAQLTPFIGGTFGVWYFVQQQQLAGMELFHTFFKDFNARYDELNDKLAALKARDSERSTTTADDAALIQDYFNLCAEEYFFYKSGHLPNEVWTAWCRGMVSHLKVGSIEERWKQEVLTGSYYGLTTEVIEKGAGLGRS